MAKIIAALNRLYKNVFVCRDCSSKIRSSGKKIAEGKVRCRKCGGKNFRPIRKEK